MKKILIHGFLKGNSTLFSGAGEYPSYELENEYMRLCHLPLDHPEVYSQAPESQDFRKPIEISGLSEKFIYVSKKTLESREIYITGLRKRFLCKDFKYPVILLKIGNSPLVFSCRIDLKQLKGWEKHQSFPADSIYDYICGHKCTPKNFVRTCKFSGKFQTLITDDQSDPNFWMVKNWKIYSIETIHSCEVHIQKKCRCFCFKKLKSRDKKGRLYVPVEDETFSVKLESDNIPSMDPMH